REGRGLREQRRDPVRRIREVHVPQVASDGRVVSGRGEGVVGRVAHRLEIGLDAHLGEVVLVGLVAGHAGRIDLVERLRLAGEQLGELVAVDRPAYGLTHRDVVERRELYVHEQVDGAYDRLPVDVGLPLGAV